MSDDFLFADDSEDEEDIVETSGSWKILIVDDEPEVHAVTKLALGDFVFQGRTLEFVSVHSGAEAKQAFRDHDDIAGGLRHRCRRGALAGEVAHRQVAPHAVVVDTVTRYFRG